jgi:hypothetical protein
VVTGRLRVSGDQVVPPSSLPSCHQFPRAIRSWGVQWDSHYAIPFVLRLACPHRRLEPEARHILVFYDQAIGLVVGFVDG